MRPEAFEYVVVTSEPGLLPFKSHQSSARAPGLMHLTILSTLAAIVVVPQLVLAGYALQSATIRQTIVDQPMVAFQLAVALAFWIGLFAWPLKGLFNRLTRARTVEISVGQVKVADTRSSGVRDWSAPLSSYRGIVHHVRSSLSGLRHELILLHQDPAKTVLLVTADRFSDAEVARMSRLLRLPHLPPSELYKGHWALESTAASSSWHAVTA
jgi:hypothetical protein